MRDRFGSLAPTVTWVTVVITVSPDRLDLVDHHAANAFASVHEIEGVVDAFQRKPMRDHRIDLDLAVHVQLDDLRSVGPSTRPAESCAFPDPAGDQLKGSRG